MKSFSWKGILIIIQIIVENTCLSKFLLYHAKKLRIENDNTFRMERTSKLSVNFK